MAAFYAASWILLLLTASATPEIPTKGKHTRLQDAQQTSVEDPDMPRFAEPIANVTVSIGRDALLACVVENLKSYKVAWVRVDTQTILSIHHNVISQNNRISLTYNDHRSWYLHIKEVEESDRGWYMCQVNTDPMRSRKGYLQVVVPPMIVEGMTSNDMVVREGLNVTLMCKARGYPEPYVMWRREDGEEMLIGGEHVNVVDGELLHITKVSRLHMAAYLCVASNGVPPSISKRVHLRVQFPPMLSIPNQLEGAYVGQDVVLECHTEAYPASINYWTTERGDMIISDTSRAGDKYETTSTVSGYTKYMKLKIRSVGPNDFGTYRCVAKNSLGETDGNIKLDEMPTPTTAILSETAMLNRSLGTMNSRKNGKHRQRSKFDSNALPDYGVEEWRDGAGNGGDGNTGDNNQTPVRNPPGAFRNSAGSLAQHNLLAGIIHWIKMQSFGIFERLSSCQPPPAPSVPSTKQASPHAHFAVAVTVPQPKPEPERRSASGDTDHKLCQATTTLPTTTTTTTSTTLRWRREASRLWRPAGGQRSVALILRLLLLAMPFLCTITHTINNKNNNNNNSNSSNPTAINTLTTTRKTTATSQQKQQLTADTALAPNAQPTTTAATTTIHQSTAATTTTTIKSTAKPSDDVGKNKRTASFAGYAPFRPKIGAAMNSNNNSNNNNCTACDYDNRQNVNNRHHDNSSNHNNSHNSKTNHNGNNNNNINNNGVLQIISNIVAVHIANNMRGNVTSLQVLSLPPSPLLASLLPLSLLLLPFPLLPARQQPSSLTLPQSQPQSQPQPQPLLLLLLLLAWMILLLLLLCYFICIAIFSAGSRAQVKSNFFRLAALSWPLLLLSPLPLPLPLLLPARTYFISNISTTTATTAAPKIAATFSISRNRHLQAAGNNNNNSYNKTLMMMKPPAVKPQIATKPIRATANTTTTAAKISGESSNKKSTNPKITTTTTTATAARATRSKFVFRSTLAR